MRQEFVAVLLYGCLPLTLFFGFDRQVRPRGHVFHDGLSSLQRQSFSVWPKIWPKTESKAKSSLTNPAKLQNNSMKHQYAIGIIRAMLIVLSADISLPYMSHMSWVCLTMGHIITRLQYTRIQWFIFPMNICIRWGPFPDKHKHT